jgi:glycosyltransferase involved in cell wall biosynthesis
MEQALLARNIEVVTVTTNDDGNGEVLPVPLQKPVSHDGSSRIYFPMQVHAYKISLPMRRWLLKEIKNFDVVHVHAVFSFAPVMAALIARKNKIPYVIRPLGVLNHYGMTKRRSFFKRLSLAMFEGRILRDAAAVHFTSEQERIEAESLGIKLRSVVLPLGIEPAIKSPADLMLSAFPALKGRRCVLYLSRIDPKKNIEALLEALMLVKKEMPAIALIICGDGDKNYISELKNLAERLNIADDIVWVGHVDGPMKASAFGAAEIFVLPSFSENFGIAPVEALSVGLPCVLAEGVAVATRVHAMGAGVSIAPTAAAVAAGILSLMSNADYRARASVQAIALAKSDYGVDTMGDRLTALYENLLSR